MCRHDCVVVGDVESCVGDGCLRTVMLLVCGLCTMCVSLSFNDIGAEGGAAIAGALHHMTSLTTLKYV
jgi:hypothetical protein